MYNLEQLKMFVEAAETGSFSACARKLGKAQSAISQGIANLEIDLGNQLFDRTSRKPTLTKQGQRLLSYAQAILLQTHELNSAASSLSHAQETHLMLAVDGALMVPAFDTLLHQFSEIFPATGIELHSIASPDIAALVHSGKADLGLMFCDLVFPKEVDLCFLGNLPFYAVCSPNHPLAQLESANVPDLLPHRQIMLKGVDGRELAQFVALSTQVWWSNSFYMIYDLLKQGMGWSYLPYHMAETGIQKKELHRISLSFDHKPWNPPIDRVMQKNKTSGPALSWLANGLKNIFDQ
ncbi:LysR family transcriptional regulator [Litoribacillus peritrichatus]|uniref:LysR family transcriptional regulator n=1 Tax=Litoribacillus peritrichatus TaxID=718191 RepID=A0ABP7N2T2_9GAMM